MYELARAEGTTDDAVLVKFLGKGFRRFDKQGEQFYDQISALHKSVRGSNPDAALYWFTRMLDGGADGAYLGRRLLRMAIEDVGLADPRAQQIALEAWQSYERLGSPEGDLALANVAVYLACCSKSNAVYSAFKQVKQVIEQTGSLDVPLHLRNAPTKLMKELGYGAGYRYDHDEGRSNGHIHPLHHFDVFYSSGSTFKLGSADGVSKEQFVDVLNLNTNCHFVSPIN